MKLKSVVAVLKALVPVTLGMAVLVLVIAWLAGAFVKKIPAGETNVRRADLAAIPAYGETKIEPVEKEYFEEAIGTLKAASRTEIAARVLARIERIHVSAGDTVAEGDVLVELDRKDFEAQLSQAEASLEAAQAALAQAKDVFERAERLRQANPGAIAQQDFNQMNSNLLKARAEESRANQGVEEAKVRLSYTTIRAPKAGTIVDRLAEEGDLAQPGVLLLSLYDRTSLRLEVPVMENLAAKIEKGQKLTVQIDALNGRKIEGVVAEKVPQAQAASLKGCSAGCWCRRACGATSASTPGPWIGSGNWSLRSWSTSPTRAIGSGVSSRRAATEKRATAKCSAGWRPTRGSCCFGPTRRSSQGVTR
jgi:membrane fusion protein (multidrug efflux system)